MSAFFDKPFTFDRVVRLLIGLLISTGILYMVFILKGVLLPFVVAWMLAYFLQPLVRFFQHRLRIRNRGLSVILVMLFFTALIALVVVMIKPLIQAEIGRAALLIDRYNRTGWSIPFIPEQWIEYIREQINFKEIENVFEKDNLIRLAKMYLPGVLSGTLATIGYIAVILLTLLYLFFILLDYERLADGWIKLIPKKARSIVANLGEEIGYNMNRYFKRQALIALIVGVLFAVGFKIIGFPLGIVLGVFLGLLNMVPYLQIIGIVPMVALCLLKAADTGQNFWLLLLSAALVMIVVQLIQDLILTPRIMGKGMGLRPAIILLSLSAWGTLLGFLGLIIALPLTVILQSYYRRFILMEGKEPEIKPEKATIKNLFKKKRGQ